MKQFEINELLKVQIDYNDIDIPDSVKIFKPLVYEDGNGYCVILGPDPQVGIFGCGPTPKEALWDWDKHLDDFKMNHEEDDEVAIYLDEVLSSTIAEKPANDEKILFETPHVKGLT
jgi:hypothetical protein